MQGSGVFLTEIGRLLRCLHYAYLSSPFFDLVELLVFAMVRASTVCSCEFILNGSRKKCYASSRKYHRSPRKMRCHLS